MENKLAEIAQWMLDEIMLSQVLEQSTAAMEIHDKFGEEFTPINDSGNMIIRKDVLAAFLKVSRDSVVWDRSELSWRLREPYDEPGRQQS